MQLRGGSVYIAKAGPSLIGGGIQDDHHHDQRFHDCYRSCSLRSIYHLPESPYSLRGCAFIGDCLQSHSGRDIQPLGANGGHGVDRLSGGILPGRLRKYVRGFFSDHLRAGPRPPEYLPAQGDLRQPAGVIQEEKILIRVPAWLLELKPGPFPTGGYVLSRPRHVPANHAV